LGIEDAVAADVVLEVVGVADCDARCGVVVVAVEEVVVGVALILVAVEENFDMHVVLYRSLDAVPEDNVVAVVAVVVVVEEVDVCTGVDDKETHDKHHIDVGVDVVQQPFAVEVAAVSAVVVAAAVAKAVRKDLQHWEESGVTGEEAEARVGDGKRAVVAAVVGEET